MFVLTQFNSESLNTHIAMTYKFDVFSSGFVTVLAAEQTEEGGDWFQGTADAVRQGLRHMRRRSARDLMILSGDQLYSMDFRQMLRTHRDSNADATVAVIPVAEDQASGFGILKMDASAASCTSTRSQRANDCRPSPPTSPVMGRGTWPRWASTFSGGKSWRRQFPIRSWLTSAATSSLMQCRANACTPTSIAATGRCRDHLVLLPGQLGAVPADSAV